MIFTTEALYIINDRIINKAISDFVLHYPRLSFTTSWKWSLNEPKRVSSLTTLYYSNILLIILAFSSSVKELNENMYLIVCKDSGVYWITANYECEVDGDYYAFGVSGGNRVDFAVDCTILTFSDNSDTFSFMLSMSLHIITF